MEQVAPERTRVVLTPMAEMSRAVRTTMERFVSARSEVLPVMGVLPDDALVEFEQILSAYVEDLRAEARLRGLVVAR